MQESRAQIHTAPSEHLDCLVMSYLAYHKLEGNGIQRPETLKDAKHNPIWEHWGTLQRSGWTVKQHDVCIDSGYHATAFVNQQQKKLVIANRGTQGISDFYADLFEVVLGYINGGQQGRAIEFATEIINTIVPAHQQHILVGANAANAVPQSYTATESNEDSYVCVDPATGWPHIDEEGWSVTLTGHSLGGFLAQTTAARLAAMGHYCHIVTFDAPGPLVHMEQIAATHFTEIDLTKLLSNIVDYVSMPNLFNTFGKHGPVRMIAGVEPGAVLFHTSKTHKLRYLYECLSQGGFVECQKWVGETWQDYQSLFNSSSIEEHLAAQGIAQTTEQHAQEIINTQVTAFSQENEQLRNQLNTQAQAFEIERTAIQQKLEQSEAQKAKLQQDKDELAERNKRFLKILQGRLSSTQEMLKREKEELHLTNRNLENAKIKNNSLNQEVVKLKEELHLTNRNLENAKIKNNIIWISGGILLLSLVAVILSTIFAHLDIASMGTLLGDAFLLTTFTGFSVYQHSNKTPFNTHHAVLFGIVSLVGILSLTLVGASAIHADIELLSSMMIAGGLITCHAASVGGYSKGLASGSEKFASNADHIKGTNFTHTDVLGTPSSTAVISDGLSSSPFPLNSK